MVAPIVSLLSSQGTRFQGTEAELDYNLMAYIPFRSPSAASPYAEKAQEIGAGKEDDDDLRGMRKELDEIEPECNRILRLQGLAKRENVIRRKIAQGGNATQVG